MQELLQFVLAHVEDKNVEALLEVLRIFIEASGLLSLLSTLGSRTNLLRDWDEVL